MATGRLTKRSVESLPIPPGSGRVYLWDEQLKGFGVMVTPAGSRSYLIQYRMWGRSSPTRRYTIGKHGSPWTADAARERATDLLEMVRKKIDPLDADRDKLAQATAAKQELERFAFGPYVETFIKRHAEARQLRSVEDIRSTFRRDLTPFFGGKSIASIRRTDVQACLDGISERSPSAANKAHKWLRKMLSFAVDRGDLAASPMEGMGPPHKEGQRQRVLRGPELAYVWRGAGKLDLPWSAFVQMLLLTGQRLREVAGMTWEELDLQAASWIVPGARTKNKRDHLVPLPASAVALLNAMQPQAKLRKGVVFSTNGSSAISGFSKLKTALDAKVQEQVARASTESGDLPIPIEPWVFHDLRRSVATGCQALGFPIEHTEALLNHVSGKRGGLAAIYQLHEYKDEKTAALNAWARHLDVLVNGTGGANVFKLVSRR